MKSSDETALEIRDLRVQYPSNKSSFVAVDGVSLTVKRGEILGLVGESGAGKSTIGWAVTRLIDAPGQITSGQILLDGKEDLTIKTEAEMCAIRGRRIGMIFQDPLSALNPVATVGAQLMRAIRLSTGLTGDAARTRALKQLQEVGIPNPEARLKQYPHQFSGGMRQRIVISIAMAGNPGLLIADEPTTALDVSVQSEVLELIKRLGRTHNAGVILVTHDMAVIQEVADRVAVMRYGKLIENGSKIDVLNSPQDPYTRALIQAVPRTDAKLQQFKVVSSPNPEPENGRRRISLDWVADASIEQPARGQPLVEVEKLEVTFCTKDAVLRRNRAYLNAVDNVSLTINAGETFGLVGESGSGKSTFARVLCGLQPLHGGSVRYRGHDIKTLLTTAELKRVRLSMQMIFQDPFSSLNPRQTIGDLLREPLLVHRFADRAQADEIVTDLLERVGLQADDVQKFPHQFSGGQRQRIGIARALTVQPRFLICDEPTSALDVSVQAQVLNLLKSLQDDLGLTMLFVSHDLAVIRQICDRVAVMQKGKICELAECETLFRTPKHAYTQKLLSLMPKFEIQVSSR